MGRRSEVICLAMRLKPANTNPVRRFRLLLVVIICLLTFQSPALSQVPDISARPSAAGSDMVADPAVRYGVLPNGLRYALMHNAQPPRSVSIRFSIRAGSLNESEDQQGLFHFIEHMAFNGSSSVPEGEMVRRLARMGIAFGADANAVTGQTDTVYSLDIPEASEERIGESLFLLRELASELSFEAEAVERERGVILAEGNRTDTFERRRRDQQFAFLTPGAYAIGRMPIGDPKTVSAATGETLRLLYDRYYRPERASLIAVGDFDLDVMEAMIARGFSTWRGRGEPGADVDTSYMLRERGPAASVFVHPDGGDGISVYFLSPYQESPDSVAGHRERMLLALAIGAANRRLSLAANAPDPPFRAASAFASDVLEGASFAGAAASVLPKQWKPALQSLEQTWRAALTYGFMDAELDQQKAILRKAFADAAAGEATRTTPSLARDLLQAIQDETVFARPSFHLALFDSTLPGATPEAVSAVFRKWMARGGTPLFFLSSSVDLASVEPEIISAWAESERAKIDPPSSKTAPSFGYSSFGPPGKIAEDRLLTEFGARSIRFENNVRLSVKRTAYQQGSVLISLRVGAGAIALEDAPFGLASLMSAFTAGGLEKHSIDELQAMLGGHTLRAGVSVSHDSFGGVYVTTPEDLHLQLQLTTAYLMHPGYRAEAERKWRESQVLSWPQLDANPRNAFASQGARLLLSGDKRFGVDPDDGVIFRSFTELEAYLSPILQGAAIEIAIVGDVDESSAIKAVAATLGALPKRAASEPKSISERPVTFTQPHTPIVITHRGEADQALLKLYWPVDIDPDREPQKARVFSLLASILELRLLEIVREELGASYTPVAGFSSSAVYPGLNYLYAEVEARPAELAQLRQALRTIASDLQAGGIAPDELMRVRAPALEQLSGHASSNGYWLNVIAQIQSRPERAARLDLAAIETDLRAVLLDDLHGAAERWLSEENVREVHIIPAPERTAVEE